MHFLYLLGSCWGATILVHSSVGGRSHIKGMLEVCRVLVERGHAVKYVALDDNLHFANEHAGIAQVGLGQKGLFRRHQSEFDSRCEGKVGEAYNIEFYNLYIEMLSETYRHEYMPLLKHVIENPPDVMVCDLVANACQEIAEARGIPLIIGMQALDVIGTFNAPFLAKDIRFGPVTTEKMPLLAKLYDTFVVPYFSGKVRQRLFAAIRRERKLVNSTATWFPRGAFHYGLGLVNSFFGFEAAISLPPHVKVIGPIMASKTTPLDAQLHKFLATHTRVMFVGFGSHLSLRQPEISAILNGAQEAMQQGYIDGLIWGLGRTSLANFPNQTRLKTDFDDRFIYLPWAPQQAILQHPSTILFLSHGGLESTVEAIHSLTPILNLPFLGDQPRNAAKLQELGIGLCLDPHNINLPPSITSLLTHPNLQPNLIKAQALTNSHPRRLHEAANHVQDHLELAQACRPHFPYTPGGTLPPCETSHLHPASTRMSFIHANRIDAYLALGTTLLALMGGILLSAKLVYSKHNPTK
ncbi:hypothetical protein DSO57_1021624 [Entomophthora muscae]|uniref:Uncharacterized protein n=1 Tax=Entomophthora muscae TaxID=34485 RepID=A0ACC2S5I5_9FUNG|nr:hypothetical protein DSO57_1021624 [Entomophthora muscae]